MPKKKPGMTPEEQVERFRDTVRGLIVAGDINPEEADAALDKVLRKSRVVKDQP